MLGPTYISNWLEFIPVTTYKLDHQWYYNLFYSTGLL